MPTEVEKTNAQQHLDWLIKTKGLPVVPAVCAGLVIGGEVVAAGATGVRKHGTNHATRPDDLFHLGSITKPLTGYLAARLIRQLRFSWARTIGDSHPESFDDSNLSDEAKTWANHYRNTTVVDLMTHTSGLEYVPLKETQEALAAADTAFFAGPDRNLRAKRKIYTTLAVNDRPFSGVEALGGCPRFRYSGGCIIVASMAEQEMGKKWETLMEEHVFEPLGITRFAFNRMSEDTPVTGTWQHQLRGGQIVSSADPSFDHIGYTHGPAGAVCLSAGDFGKLLAAIIEDPGDLLGAAIRAQYLNTPAGLRNTQGGWIGGNGRFRHNGSNTWNYANAVIDTNKRLGVFACVNIYSERAEEAVHDMCEELEAAGDAWGAFAHLHQAIDPTHIEVTTDGAVTLLDNHPRLVNDRQFKTRWRAPTETPALNCRLDQPRRVKGLVICQASERIQTFDVEIDPGELGGPKTTLEWPTLSGRTVRSANNLVIRTNFPETILASKIRLKVRTATNQPRISRLLLLQPPFGPSLPTPL